MQSNQAFVSLIKKFLNVSTLNFALIQSKTEQPFQSYVQFWELLSVPENNTQYLSDLIYAIVNCERNKSRHGRQYTIENLLATLFVITLWRQLYTDKKKDIFQELKLQWEEFIADKYKKIVDKNQKRQNPCPYSNQIINNMFNIHESSEDIFISNLIGQLCFIPFDISKLKIEPLAQSPDTQKFEQLITQYYQAIDEYMKQVFKGENLQYYSCLIPEEAELNESGEFSYAYEYLILFLRHKKHGEIPKTVFDSLKNYYKLITQICQLYPDQAEKSILSLLHLTKQLYTMFSSNDSESTRQLLLQIQIFRRYPYPVGTLASEVIKLLYSECRSPGNAFRYKIREEVPTLDFSKFIDNNKIIQQIPQDKSEEYKQEIYDDIDLIKANKSETDPMYTAYLVTDLDHFENIYLTKFLEAYEQNHNIIRSIHVLRIAMVANMLNIAKKQYPDFQIVLEISTLSKQNVFLLYSRLLHIIEKCEELDSIVDIKLIQENSFCVKNQKNINNIIKEIVKDIKQMQKEEALDQSETFQNIQKSPTNFIPAFPYPQLISFNKKQVLQQFKKQNEKNELLVFEQYNNPRSLTLSSLHPIIKNINLENMPLHQEPLKLIVMGGDVELHHLTQELGCYFTEKPQMFQQLDIRIFLVPTKKCALAHYIATLDPWYQRYLYLPIANDLLLPRIEQLIQPIKYDQETHDREKEPLLPQELKLQIIHTYLREANRSFNVRVYKATITYQQSEENIIYINQVLGKNYKFANNQQTQRDNVYFCQYVKVGASFEHALSKYRQKQDNQNSTFYDMKKKGQIKFQQQELELDAVPVDFQGNLLESNQITQQIHNLNVNNVYTDYFEGNMPLPNSHWLELSYINYENSKLFDSSLGEEKLFKKNERQQLQAAFKALYTSLPIHSIEIHDRSNKSFNACIDGKIYLGIQSMAIKPLESEDKVLKLPIMSFLPVRI